MPRRRPRLYPHHVVRLLTPPSTFSGAGSEVTPDPSARRVGSGALAPDGVRLSGVGAVEVLFAERLADAASVLPQGCDGAWWDAAGELERCRQDLVAICGDEARARILFRRVMLMRTADKGAL